MTIGEKLGLGIQTTGLGIMVVFIALALIIVILMVLSAAMKDRKKEKSQPEKQPEVAEKPVETISVASTQDDELVAVLTAAVSAYMLSEGNTGNLVVRSYRRVGNASPWAKAGRNAQIYNKF